MRIRRWSASPAVTPSRRWREFVERHGLEEMVHIADVDGAVWDDFGVVGQPAWASVTADTGEVTVRFGPLGRPGVLDAFAAGGL